MPHTTRSFMQRVIAWGQRRRDIPVWQLGLGLVIMLGLLVGLLWPGPPSGPQQTLVPAPPVVAEVPVSVPVAMPPSLPEPAPAPQGMPDITPLPEPPQTPTLAPLPQRQRPTPPHEVTGNEDAQAMQKLLTRLEAERNGTDERLDTSGMDQLLARLETTDKTLAPVSPRAKMARKRGSRSLPRAITVRGAPGPVSSPGSDPTLRRPAPEWPFADAPKPGNDSMP